jgi:hypothetical protein
MHIGVMNRGLVGHFSWFCDLEALREGKRSKWSKRPFDTEMDQTSQADIKLAPPEDRKLVH